MLNDFEYTGAWATVMCPCFCFIYYVKQNCLSFNALRSISICQLLRFNASFSSVIFQFIHIYHILQHRQLIQANHILGRIWGFQQQSVCIDVRHLYEVGNKISLFLFLKEDVACHVIWMNEAIVCLMRLNFHEVSRRCA